MRLDDRRESGNVEDRRGSRRGGGLAIGGGIGGVVLMMLSMLLGVDPAIMLDQVGRMTEGQRRLKVEG